MNLSANFEKVEAGKVQIIEKNYAGKRIANEKVTIDMPIFAFSVGDVAFVTAPNEVFCENGRAVKEQSPFKMTFFASCSNTSLGYLPSSSAFEYDCYEVSITKFARGTAEELVTEQVKLLKQLYETKP